MKSLIKYSLVLIALLAVDGGTVLSAKARKPVTVTPAQCAQIRAAVQTFGITVVLAGARMRGFTPAQVAYARRVCRV